MTQSSIADVSKSPDSPPEYDIEHVPVENDPRKWTPSRKVRRRLLDLRYLYTDRTPFLPEFYISVDILSGHDRRIISNYSKPCVAYHRIY